MHHLPKTTGLGIIIMNAFESYPVSKTVSDVPPNYLAICFKLSLSLPSPYAIDLNLSLL
jgi:hypothetical protein